MLVSSLQANDMDEAEPIEFWHIEIGDHQVNMPAIEMFQRILAINAGQGCIPFLFKREADHLHYKIRIVHYQYGLIHNLDFNGAVYFLTTLKQLTPPGAVHPIDVTPNIIYLLVYM